jgi:hypothetical protein
MKRKRREKDQSRPNLTSYPDYYFITTVAIKIYVLQNVHTRSRAHTACCSLGTGVERPGRGVDCSPSSSAAAKNKWRCTSTHRVFVHAVDSEKFIFYYQNSAYNNIYKNTYSIKAVHVETIG